MSYEGGTWKMLWETEGFDRVAHTDFEQNPPEEGDVVMELETAEFRREAGQKHASLFVRREIRSCEQPFCRSSDELLTTVTWQKMKRMVDGYRAVDEDK